MLFPRTIAHSAGIARAAPAQQLGTKEVSVQAASLCLLARVEQVWVAARDECAEARAEEAEDKFIILTLKLRQKQYKKMQMERERGRDRDNDNRVRARIDFNYEFGVSSDATFAQIHQLIRNLGFHDRTEAASNDLHSAVFLVRDIIRAISRNDIWVTFIVEQHQNGERMNLRFKKAEKD